MGIEGFFNRVTFGRKGVQQATDVLDAAVAAELQRIDLYRRGLGAEVIRHVAHGDNSSAMDLLAACCKATPAYAAPYHQDHAAKRQAQDATNLGLVLGTIAPSPSIGRLMAVRHAIGAFHPPFGAGQLTVERLQLLALFAAIDCGVAASRVNYSVPWDRLIGLPALRTLIETSGGELADLFGFILGRGDTRFLTPGSWHAGEAFGALVRAAPDAFAHALLATDMANRPAAVALTEHHGVQALPKVVTALVAMLTRPFDKKDRELAISALARLEPATLLATMEREFAAADIDARFGLVQAAGRNSAPELIALLRDRDRVEKAAKVKAAIQAVLEANQPASVNTPEQPGYAAIDGGFVAIPPMIALEAQAPEASDSESIAYMACVDAIDAQRAAMLAQQEPGPKDRSRYCQPLTRAEIHATFDLFTRGIPLPPGITHSLGMALRASDAGAAWYTAVLDRLPFPVALRSILGQGNGELGKMLVINGYVSAHARFLVARLHEWLDSGAIGMRELVEAEAVMAAARAVAGQEAPVFDSAAQLRRALSPATTRYFQNSLATLPHAALWPWLADNLAIFDEALGLHPATVPIPLDAALATLALLPAVPRRYLGKLTEIAVAEKRPLRRQAMLLLRGATGLDQRIVALLDDARQQVRVNAASWLADIRADCGEAALHKRLRKEKSDPVRAALIQSLQRLGADLSALIGPATLIADARAALDKGPAGLPDWLVTAGLPTLHFRDGAALPPSVLRHWLAFAIRLKDPAAAAQFGLYLDQLDTADARTLSNWVLESWISFDTQSASLDDANAYAVANFAQDYRWRHRQQTAELRDLIIAELRRQKLGEMPNSGSDTKGVLALACRADPIWAANRVRWFLKKHGRRSHQAMALLDVLAGIAAPATLQVVVAASARLKQKSTQAHAAAIAERYAEDRGWSVDELADRTVPDAGFDDEGILELPCGDGRVYTARLDARLAIHLFNAEGKPVKALPAANDEASRDSLKTLSAAKKELKQVIDLQASRLFEAMCVERSWPVSDWRIAFREHPVMRRLVERLVWQGLDTDGRPLGLFRPTQEGDCTDAEDGIVEVDSFARIRLAHGALVDAATCRAWIAHLKDYEVAPILAQFDTLRAPLSREQGDADAVVDRLGWIALSLAYRGVAEKRGYERVIGDNGGCHEYVKSFASHGMTAMIHHSGSHAVDENTRVALKHLSFHRAGNHAPCRLKDVPAVMLAECWADYHAMAAKGGFDAEWQKITAW